MHNVTVSLAEDFLGSCAQAQAVQQVWHVWEAQDWLHWCCACGLHMCKTANAHLLACTIVSCLEAWWELVRWMKSWNLNDYGQKVRPIKGIQACGTLVEEQKTITKPVLQDYLHSRAELPPAAATRRAERKWLILITSKESSLEPYQSHKALRTARRGALKHIGHIT